MTAIKGFMRGGEYARQTFLTGIIVGFGGVATAILGLPILGYILSPVIDQPKAVWRDLGLLSEFKVGETVEKKYLLPSSKDTSFYSGSTSIAGCYVRRNSQTSFSVFSMYCTHLGCPIHWIQESEMFLCPCHGSAFYENGSVAAPPAELPLVQLEWSATRTKGHLMIKTGHIPVA